MTRQTSRVTGRHVSDSALALTAAANTRNKLRVLRRDDPVTCPICNRVVRRKARQQTFCSARCRKRAQYARDVAKGRFYEPGYRDSGNGTKPIKNASDINNLQCQKSGPTKFANSPLNLLGGGSWHWPGTSRLNPNKHRAIIDGEIGGRFIRAMAVGDASINHHRPTSNSMED
jgi:hypothetical protein